MLCAPNCSQEMQRDSIPWRRKAANNRIFHLFSVSLSCFHSEKKVVLKHWGISHHTLLYFNLHRRKYCGVILRISQFKVSVFCLWTWRKICTWQIVLLSEKTIQIHVQMFIYSRCIQLQSVNLCCTHQSYTWSHKFAVRCDATGQKNHASLTEKNKAHRPKVSSARAHLRWTYMPNVHANTRRCCARLVRSLPKGSIP